MTRLVQAIPTGELERRWNAARALMARHDIDALVMQNANDWLGGYVRWFSGAPANNAYPRAIIFPAEGGMTIVEQGAFGATTHPDADDLSARGVSRIRHTPSYTTAGFTQAYDAELAADELRGMNVRRVGWVNPAGAYYGFGRALEALCGNIQFLDVTDEIDQLKAVKSAEEWKLIETTTALQDEVVSAVRAFIKPGLRDFEIAAFAQYEAHRRGAEQGIFLNSSSQAGKAAVFRPPHMQGRTIESGDVFALLVETNGPGGYYTEIGRTFVLGQASERLKQSLDDAVAAQAHTLQNLKPGALCSEIAVKHDRYMESVGLPAEKRLYAHGMGYDMVERPLVRADETMRIEKDMSIVVHPGYIDDEVFALICDNYRIGADGAGACLHRTPKEILEV